MPSRPIKSFMQGDGAKENRGYVHREHRSKKGRKKKSDKFFKERAHRRRVDHLFMNEIKKLKKQHLI